MLNLIERWLIRKNYYRLAEEEYKKYALRRGRGGRDFSEHLKLHANNQMFLSAAYDWAETKQGFDFWLKIHKEYNQYLEKWKYSTTSKKK